MNRNSLFLFFILLWCIISFAQAQSDQTEAIPLQFNSSVNGSTTGKNAQLYTAAMAISGQVVYSITVPAQPDITQQDIMLTTCNPLTNFDTVIYLLSNNPLIGIDSISSQINVALNDTTCNSASVQKSTLIQRVAVGVTYYVVVSSPRNTDGNYTLTFTLAPTLPAAVPWGLDRIDQRSLPLDNRFTVVGGRRTFVYILDSGIRPTHSQLSGRVSFHADFTDDGPIYQSGRQIVYDCTGSGTSLAGIVAGLSVGVADQASLIDIRVKDCNSRVNLTKFGEALDFIYNHTVSVMESESLDIIAAALIGFTLNETNAELDAKVAKLAEVNVTVVVAAGNNNDDTCATSFGSAGNSVLRVGGTYILDGVDTRMPESNYGPCNDIYAPGNDIWSAFYQGDYSFRSTSGTGQAAAFVAGAVAILKAGNRHLTPADVKRVLRTVANLGIIANTVHINSNRLLFVRSIPDVSGFGQPESGYYFIFSRLKANTTSCDGLDTTYFANIMADAVGVARDQMIARCNSVLDLNGLRRDVTTGLENLLTRQIAIGNQTLITYRANVNEFNARRVYDKMERVIYDELGKETLGYVYTISEEPWAVDSTGATLWSPPDQPPPVESGLSSGEIAAIVVGCIAGVLLIASLIYIWYRKYVKTPQEDEEDKLYASADEEEEDLVFEEKGLGITDVVRSLGFMKGPDAAGVIKGKDLLGKQTNKKIDHTDGIMRFNSFRGESFVSILTEKDKADRSLNIDAARGDDDLKKPGKVYEAESMGAEALIGMDDYIPPKVDGELTRGKSVKAQKAKGAPIVTTYGAEARLDDDFVYSGNITLEMLSLAPTTVAKPSGRLMVSRKQVEEALSPKRPGKVSFGEPTDTATTSTKESTKVSFGEIGPVKDMRRTASEEPSESPPLPIADDDDDESPPPPPDLNGNDGAPPPPPSDSD